MSLKDETIEKERALTTVKVRHSKQRLRSLLSSQFKEISSLGDYFGLNEALQQLVCGFRPMSKRASKLF